MLFLISWLGKAPLGRWLWSKDLDKMRICAMIMSQGTMSEAEGMTTVQDLRRKHA